mmetsp:Transcript_4655/g.7559  ORF Transcript_4655/g.7559 Transcript_4655/m.7559 type:complete len:481 (+) Transcript_4655:61-1503(+)|eukprot:CAMPEP_0169078174 /NCGR_PEP_ID=MMETSP1015-20121227/9273_1 /TAXON_ID=342587 /ORGANISM="Karlodinium micrum, Strain CCMP2283" /LENGTH=480 /DNA_ID=CAMNT_0009137751 /DNA_START=39 /DNA_END=1481 /DNA_ORIENTATION=-
MIAPTDADAPLRTAPNEDEVVLELSMDAKPRLDQYSAPVCGMFMLNMVLGTGPMTLPYAFNQAGILLSAIFLGGMMSISYVTATYVVEGLATADKLKAARANGLRPEDENARTLSGGNPDEARIETRSEFGDIAKEVFPSNLSWLAYLIVIVYAYGVLTVYVISGCESLSGVVGNIAGVDSYYIFLVIFAVIVTPVCLLDFQKTKPLQIFIGALRVTVVVVMMTVMIRFLARSSEPITSRKWREIPLFRIEGLPSLFGNAAFTFMIHHSIPGLVFPLRRHASSAKVIGTTYLGSYAIYMVLGLLALWSFGDEQWAKCPNTPSHPCEIQGLFNQNFASADWQWAAKFIVCYPVLVVSVFPLVAITLRNNLKAAFSAPQSASSLDCRHLAFTLLTVAPPYIVASLTKDVQVVLKYVGCYFGLGLMALVPALIVYFSRRQGVTSTLVGSGLRSQFGKRAHIFGVLIAFAAAVIFSTVTFIIPA